MKIDQIMILVTVVIVGMAISLTQIESFEMDDNLTKDSTQLVIPDEPPIYDEPSFPYEDLYLTRATAYDNFLTRNNHHIIRISEYQKYWGDNNTNDSLNELLFNIKQERKLIDEFQHEVQSEQELINQQEDFRTLNDKVVSQLVGLLVNEYHFHITQILTQDNSDKIIKSFTSQMDIASQITATSFPKTDTFPNFDHVASTFLLSQMTEQEIIHNEKSEIPIRERHDVKEVGDNQNTIQVLFSVIKCQQELRINAEDYMRYIPPYSLFTD